MGIRGGVGGKRWGRGVCRGEEESVWRILMACQEVEYL